LAEDLANFRLSAVARPESQSDSCSFCTAMSNLTDEDSSGEDLMHSSDDDHEHEHEHEHDHDHENRQDDGEIKIEIKTEQFEHELDEETMSQDLHTDSPAKGYNDTPWEPSMMPDEYKACWDQPKRQDSPTSPDDFSPEWTEPASPDPETAESDRITHADTNIDGHSFVAPEATMQLPAFHMPTQVVLSPQTPKSVPVVEQARRARHPVYKFGSLANETFEGGRHQEAFDLYSWALLLLNPQEGTMTRDLLARPSVIKELEKLGWRCSVSFAEREPLEWSRENISRISGIGKRPTKAEFKYEAKTEVAVELRAEAGITSNASNGDAEDSDRNEPMAGRKTWLSFSRSTGGWWSSSRRGQQQRAPPPIKLFNSDIEANAAAASESATATVIVNEPLPAGLVQTPSGKYEFSSALLEQINNPAFSPLATAAPERRSNGGLNHAPDPWFMAAGDERTDITALLYSNRSAAAYALGKYLAAATDASLSISLRPTWAKGHFRRGEALLALGRVREAHAGYRKAAALEPHDIHVRVSCERARILAQNESMGLRVVQMLAGRDFALKPRGLHPIRASIFRFAQGMQNFIYLIADEESRKCVVVDACWDVDGILAVIEREKLLLAAAAVTHSHFDHTGGMPPPPFASLRIRVSGVAELKRRMPHLPLLVHPLDIPDIIESNPQLQPRHFTPTPNGFSFRLGDRTDLHFMHTPGHTPGSQCVLVNGCRLFSGDTLFPGSCGRVDLKGGSLPDMLESLRTRLCAVPDNTIVYPGHEYGGEWTSIGREKKRGFLRPDAHPGCSRHNSVDVAGAANSANATVAV
ncbi:hypothetical protein LPJ66_003115, partial [Kickxella alabastrina]